MILRLQSSCKFAQFFCLFVLAVGLLFIVGHAEGADSYDSNGLEKYERWDAGIVELFGSLPVLEEGRLKPIETVARYKLLRMNNAKSLKVKVGKEEIKLSATEWILDCLFRPELAKKIPIFKVNNPDVLINLGFKKEQLHKSPRVRYSHEEFFSKGILGEEGELLKKAKLYYEILKDPNREQEAKALRRDPVKAGTLSLKSNTDEFMWLLNALNFVREGLDVELGMISPEFKKTGNGMTKLSYFLEVLDKLREVANRPETDKAFLTELDQALEKLRVNTMHAGRKVFDKRLNLSTTSLAILPPLSRSDEEWLKPGFIIWRLLFETEIFRPQDDNSGGINNRQMTPEEKAVFSAWALPKLKALERLTEAVDLDSHKVNGVLFKKELQAFHDDVVGEAEERGEYGKVKLEIFNNRAGLFHWALGFYFLAFLLIAFTWLAPGSGFARFAGIGVWAMTVVATVALIFGIILRSFMLGRPPISTLYETIPFITASAILLCLFIEWFDRKRIALAVSTLLGVGGMFLAMRFEIKEARDTLKVLEAVLRSNFWLGTHVIAINIGYAAALLAGAIGHVYIFAALFGVKNRDFLKSVTRMVYGVSCFGLVFALVGTVLGGVWANDSWGRFWGWDPKENGALMICIGILVMLHARMGGLIKDLGISMLAVFVGIITVFSWWHVNQLETGLHSYGFTDGIMFWLYLVYGIEFSVIALGVIAFFNPFGRSQTGQEQS